MATKWQLSGPLATTISNITTGPTNRATAFVSGMGTGMTAQVRRNNVVVLTATIPGPLTSSAAVATLAVVTAPTATITTTDVDDGQSYIFALKSGDGLSEITCVAGPTTSADVPIEISEDLDSASTVNIGPLNFDFDIDVVSAVVGDTGQGVVSGASTPIALPTVGSQGVVVVTVNVASTSSVVPPTATISGFTPAFDRILSNPVGGAARAARLIQFYREGAVSAGTVTVTYSGPALGSYTYYHFANRQYEKSYSQELTQYSSNPSSPSGSTSYADVIKLSHMATNQYKRLATPSVITATTSVSSQDGPSIAGGYTTQALAGSVAAVGWTLTDPVGGNGSEQTQSSLTLLKPFGASPSTGGGGSGSFVASSPPSDGGGAWTITHTENDPPIQIPWHFYGWHRIGGSFPTANYNYPLDRNWDYSVGGGADCSWARCNPSPGVYNWAGPDNWIQRTNGKFRLFTVSLTPEWAVAPQNRIYTSTSGVRYPTFPNSSFPPGDMSHLATFVTAVINRYGSAIDAFECWNEPFCGVGGETNPDATYGQANAFYNGSIRQLVLMARTMKQAIRASSQPNIPLWGCAWEGKADVSNQWGNTNNGHFKLFCTTSDGAGGIGIDHIDCHTFHPYMYQYDPVRVYSEAVSYHRMLQTLATNLGRPAIALMPTNADETGHEAPGYAENNSYEIISRNLKQSVGYALAGAKYNCAGIVLYQDNFSPRYFKAPINDNSLMLNAAEYANNSSTTREAGGKVIRQIAIRTSATGQTAATWIRFDDNSEYLA